MTNAVVAFKAGAAYVNVSHRLSRFCPHLQKIIIIYTRVNEVESIERERERVRGMTPSPSSPSFYMSVICLWASRDGRRQ